MLVITGLGVLCGMSEVQVSIWECRFKLHGAVQELCGWPEYSVNEGKMTSCLHLHSEFGDVIGAKFRWSTKLSSFTGPW